MNLPDYYTPNEAAARLGVGVGTLRRWAAEGKLSRARTLGGQSRYLRHQIELIRVFNVSGLGSAGEAQQ